MKIEIKIAVPLRARRVNWASPRLYVHLSCPYEWGKAWKSYQTSNSRIVQSARGEEVRLHVIIAHTGFSRRVALTLCFTLLTRSTWTFSFEYYFHLSDQKPFG